MRWVNGSGIMHNITGPGDFGYIDLPADGEIVFRVSGSGVYPYACTLHPGMSGALVVGDGTPSTGTAGQLVSATSNPGGAGTSGGDASGGASESADPAGSDTAAGSDAAAGAEGAGAREPAVDTVAARGDSGSVAWQLAGVGAAAAAVAAAILLALRRPAHPAA